MAQAPATEPATHSPPPPPPANAAAPPPLLAIQRGPEDAPLLPVGDDDPALALTAQLLGRRVRVTVPDGRTITGTFACLDPQANIVLTDARAVVGGGGGGEHALGSLIVPLAQRAGCALEVEPHERAELQARVEAALARQRQGCE